MLNANKEIIIFEINGHNVRVNMYPTPSPRTLLFLLGHFVEHYDLNLFYFLKIFLIMKFECMLDSKINVMFFYEDHSGEWTHSFQSISSHCLVNGLTIAHNSCNLFSKVSLVKVFL